MKGSLLLYNLKLTCLIFSTGLNSSLIIFIRTYTVNCRNALDTLRVHMNIISCFKVFFEFISHSATQLTVNVNCASNKLITLLLSSKGVQLKLSFVL